MNLAELKPPSVMPNGNVGTPTVVFLALIRDCRMPARLIGKFGLVFPKLRGKRKYGSVPFDYGSHLVRMEDEDEFEEDVKTARGQVLTDFYSRPRTEEEEPNKTHDVRKISHSVCLILVT